MKAVIQQHPEGCALACAAMLAGRTYEEVAEAAGQLGIHAGNKTLYGSTKPLRGLLASLEIPVASVEIPFDTWNALPDQALLAVKWHLEDGTPLWHWVVFIRDENGPAVLDPAAYLDVNKRTDFSEIQPKWFIEVLL